MKSLFIAKIARIRSAHVFMMVVLALIASHAFPTSSLATPDDSSDLRDIVASQLELSRVRPDPAYAEKQGDRFRLNFDFELENNGPDDIEITFIGMRVFDEQGMVLTRRSMGGNGLPGPIAMLPEATVPAQGTRYIFNPFPDLSLPAMPHRARMTVGYAGRTNDFIVFDVHFHTAPGPTLERLPLEGVAYVFTGNDLFAHHRRVALDSEPARDLGMDHIAQRFALDFTRIDPATGDLATGVGAQQSDWFGFGAEVLSPVSGRIVAVRTDMPDNAFDATGQRVFIEDFEGYGPDRGLGNYVILHVEDGAYLLASHFKQDTIAVKVGDRVEAGDRIGLIGMSGDTAYPHLHIQLQNGVDYLKSKPLPILFACMDDGIRERQQWKVDTGDFVRPCDAQSSR